MAKEKMVFFRTAIDILSLQAPGGQTRANENFTFMQAFSPKMTVQGRILGERLLTCYAFTKAHTMKGVLIWQKN